MISQELGIQYCGFPDLYKTLIGIFVDKYENHLTLLEAAFWEDRKLLVHSIKGVSLNVGSRPLYEICLKQEAVLKQENILLDEYKIIFSNTIKCLKEIL